MAADLADLCVDARWIMPMTARALLLEEHSAVVRDGRILAILPRAEARHRYRSTLLVERPRHVLLPGLVNACTRAAAPSLPGQSVGDGALIAIAAMLTGGVTCYGAADFQPDERARSAAEQGIRAVIGMPVAEFASPWAATSGEYLTRALSLRDEYKGHPTVSTAFAPQALNSLGDEALSRIATLVDELDAGVQIRVQELPADVGDSLSRHGLRPLERLQALGLLTPALNAIGMDQTIESDLELAQRGGISVTLCPAASLGRGNGPAALGALAGAGLRAGLGSDRGDAVHDQDLWTSIRLLGLSAGAPANAGAPLHPWDCLAIATRGGAAALGLEAQIGTLESGKWADLCCLDLGGPMTQPSGDLAAQLVFSGGRDMVTDVWIAGRQLLAERQLTRLDWPAVVARAAAWGARTAGKG